MYDNILVTLDGTATDRAIIEHVKKLALIMHSRLVLLHVVTSAVAQWRGADAGGKDVEKGRAYVTSVADEMQTAGISAQPELAFGDPVKEIVKWIDENGCDLVAMSTHGHGFMADIILGTTASRVQHSTSVPVLLLRAK